MGQKSRVDQSLIWISKASKSMQDGFSSLRLVVLNYDGTLRCFRFCLTLLDPPLPPPVPRPSYLLATGGAIIGRTT